MLSHESTHESIVSPDCFSCVFRRRVRADTLPRPGTCIVWRRMAHRWGPYPRLPDRARRTLRPCSFLRYVSRRSLPPGTPGAARMGMASRVAVRRVVVRLASRPAGHRSRLAASSRVRPIHEWAERARLLADVAVAAGVQLSHQLSREGVGMKRQRAALLLIALLLCAAAAPAEQLGWDTLEPGLELGVFEAPMRSAVGDSRVRVLRIDPAHFELRLVCASNTPERTTRNAREWCNEAGLVAATNPSMYQTDYLSSVSLMVTGDHVNNPRVSPDKSILAFAPKADTLPPVMIIDRQCDNFTALRRRYGGLVQSIRMISCTGRNVWAQQNRRWSTAAVAVDSTGNVLFIHVRSPYSTHDLIEVLQSLPLAIGRCMYGEGGPEAQLYVRAGGREHEWCGSYETGYNENDEVVRSPRIPNVIGIVRRTPPGAAP
ncbi:MAG: hypothetical protein GF331_23305 [Chitinivibrionales bacterium]|nr:hypothetical protein [Chitinivibrionales bacterium]